MQTTTAMKDAAGIHGQWHGGNGVEETLHQSIVIFGRLRLLRKLLQLSFLI
jgi:hypothetical protein